MSNNVLYTHYRNTAVVYDDFEVIKAELIQKLQAFRRDLDPILDQVETYSFNASGVRILDKDCKPIRKLEYWLPIIKSDATVGFWMLRVNNIKPKCGVNFLLDSLERTYELRFKVFGGLITTVEAAGISVTQTSNGTLFVNSGSVDGFHIAILKNHWEEFKALSSGIDLTKPSKKEVYTDAKVIYARA